MRVLPDYPREGYTFSAVDWSPDGRLVAGMLRTPADERSGITVFDLERDVYEELTEKIHRSGGSVGRTELDTELGGNT